MAMAKLREDSGSILSTCSTSYLEKLLDRQTFSIHTSPPCRKMIRASLSRCWASSICRYLSIHLPIWVLKGRKWGPASAAQKTAEIRSLPPARPGMILGRHLIRFSDNCRQGQAWWQSLRCDLGAVSCLWYGHGEGEESKVALEIPSIKSCLPPPLQSYLSVCLNSF